MQLLYKYYFMILFFIGGKIWHEKPILKKIECKCGMP